MPGSAGDISTFWSGCGAIRRDLSLDSGGFDAKRYPCPAVEDIELGMRMRAAGHRIGGDKNSQRQDIERAIAYWKEYQDHASVQNSG